MAGTTGALCGNIPADVVRSVVQKKMFLEPGAPVYGISVRGVMQHISVAGDIVRESGFRSLYSGWAAKCIQLSSSMALMTLLIPAFSQIMGVKYDMG